jgi:hypothetical protein
MQQLIKQVVRSCCKEQRKKNGKLQPSPYQIYELLDSSSYPDGCRAIPELYLSYNANQGLESGGKG